MAGGLEKDKGDKGMSNKAILIKKLDGFTGDARLYRLDPPLIMKDYDGNVILDKKGNATAHQYVVVSATDAMFSGPETFIFPANKTGNITSWSELNGSFKGDLDHEEALRNAGYSIVEE